VAFAGVLVRIFVGASLVLTPPRSRGANCRFLHAGSTTTVPGAFVVELCQVEPFSAEDVFVSLSFQPVCCQDFARGRCTRGTSCRFRCD
jgi:hypothetical protein